MNLLSLDLSLSATGWAAKHASHPVATGTFSPAGKGAARLADAARWIEGMYGAWNPDLTLIEGYSFSSRNSQAHSLGELGGVVRLRLHQLGARVVEVSPASRAKLATGKGNAGKDQVLVEAVRRLNYSGHSNDEADALWLLQAALIRYQLPGAAALPKGHLDALAKIEWPAMPFAMAS